MATEKRLIDANACPCAKCDRLGSCRPGICEEFAEWWFLTVDAVEVVHGRWNQDGVYDVCSVCNNCTLMPHLKGLSKFNYCPNCGAKMDGDGNG